MSEKDWLYTPSSAFNDLSATEYFCKNSDGATLNYINGTFVRMGKSEDEARALCNSLMLIRIEVLDNKNERLKKENEALKEELATLDNNLSGITKIALNSKYSDDTMQMYLIRNELASQKCQRERKEGER